MNYKCTHNYPGGPDVGYISKPHKVQPETDENCHYYNHNWFDPKLYPEFWELVEENIKVGDYIWRVWPSGKKTLGIACGFSDYKYDYKNTSLSFTHFWSLENYDSEGGVRKNEGYGAGYDEDDYKYELATDSEVNKYLESIKPILITEDGHGVFEKELLYTVGFTNKVDGADYYKIATINMKYTNKPNDIDYKWFKSKDKAESWIEENKPQYSKKEVEEFLEYSIGNIKCDKYPNFEYWIKHVKK